MSEHASSEHASDCAVHNEPAFSAGLCDCGADDEPDYFCGSNYCDDPACGMEHRETL